MRASFANLICATILMIFSLIMRHELENIPIEGTIFPLSVIYCLMFCSLILAIRSLFIPATEKSPFFGQIPPARWCVVCSVFLLMAWGAMFLSFKIFMTAGMFAILVYLNPVRNLRALAVEVIFVAGFICFFHFFFTEVMKIYFPENL